jgi:hemolysin III
MIWLVIGGLCYTGGVVFYVSKRIPYNHAIWHLFVLGGSVSHFFAMLLYVLPLRG